MKVDGFLLQYRKTLKPGAVVNRRMNEYRNPTAIFYDDGRLCYFFRAGIHKASLRQKTDCKISSCS